MSLSLYMHWAYINLPHLQIPCSLHVRQNRRGMCQERTQTHIYILTMILFIYNIMEIYIKHYLYEPDVRCSLTHFCLSICLLAGKCQASSHLSITRIYHNRTGYTGTGWGPMACHLYRLIGVMSVEQITCVTFWLDALGLHSEHVHVIFSWYDARR